jgi:hypothetical protein
MYLFMIPISVTRLSLVVIMVNIKLLATSFYGIAFICLTSCSIASCFPYVSFTLTFRGVFTNLQVSMPKQLRMFPTYFNCMRLMVLLALFLIIWMPIQYSTSYKYFIVNSWEKASFTLLMTSMVSTKIKRSSTYKGIKALS